MPTKALSVKVGREAAKRIAELLAQDDPLRGVQLLS
jgi:hypothetical protein